MKKKKLVLSSLFFVLLFGAVVYIIFSNYDINTIYANLKLINYKYIIISLFLVFMYFVCQGIYMKYIFKLMDSGISLFKGIYYALLEFLFNAVTPGSTGGQPVQLYYMYKDGISTTKSLVAIILNTIIFKLYLLCGAVLIIIFDSGYIYDNGVIISILFWFGIGVDVILIIANYMLMYNQKLIRKILDVFYRVKRFIFRKSNDDDNAIDDILSKYMGEAKFLKGHYKEIVFSVFITFIQRTLMFSITYVIYRGFGFNDISYFDLLLLQIFVQITIEGIILPGGVGISEFVINNMYVMIFGSLSISGMILNRTLSFYIPLLVIIFIVMFVSRYCYKKGVDVNEKNG